MHLTLVLSLLLLGFAPAQSHDLKGFRESSESSSESNDLSSEKQRDDFSVSALIEKANKNLGKAPGDPIIKFGDIAVKDGLQNADRCTSQNPGCKWPKHKNGKVYVPYIISNQFGPDQIKLIKATLNTFHKTTCIRFKRRRNEEDYIHIVSRDGCYSYVGRTGGEQILSLDRSGCVYKSTIQHELLHALGFHHEQCRSDRDNHVRIAYENILEGYAFAFDKIDTNNLGTPYDYGSVMHYGRHAFSKNSQPTIIPIPDENADIGHATEMSANDIVRIVKVYCE